MKERMPKGWIEVQLSEIILLLESGNRPKGGVRGIESGIPSIGGEHLNRNGGFNFDSIKYVPLNFYNHMKKGHIKLYDILIVKDGATTGKTSFVSSEFPFKKVVVNEHVFLLRCVKEVCPSFIYRFLWSEDGQKRILSNFQGAAQGGINRKFINNIIVPLPPLNEQRRIAAKLDQIMPRVEDVKERLERIPKLIKRFRQSVLTAAVTGKLTEKWREQHPSHEWRILNLGKIVKSSCNGLSKRKGISGKNIIVLRLSDFIYGKRIFGRERKIKLSDKELKKYLLNYRDILVVRVNGSRDNAGLFIVYKWRDEAYCDHFIRLSIDFSKAIPEFVALLANSKLGRDYIEENLVTSAGQNTISQKTLFKLKIPLPPLEEQKEIVRQVDRLFALADKMETHYKIAKEKIEKLPQSILAKAFRGELVPQNPNDEPAHILLEKIKTQKEQLETEKKKKPKKYRGILI